MIDQLVASVFIWKEIVPEHPNHVQSRPSRVIQRNYNSSGKSPNQRQRVNRKKIQSRRGTSVSPRPTAIETEKDAILVISPHPDDEILCCASTMSKALKQNKDVFIVYFTDGDGLEINAKQASKAYGKTRRSESQTAAQKLGIPSQNLFFLNFPDQGLSELGARTSASPFTAQRSSNAQSYKPKTPYTRAGLKQNLRGILKQIKPHTVYTPSIQDKHPDHRAATLITHSLLKELQQTPSMQYYTIHGRKPAAKATVDHDKTDLIRIFQSQFHDQFHADFLERFAWIPEIFD